MNYLHETLKRNPEDFTLAPPEFPLIHESLEGLTHEQVDPFTYYASQSAAVNGIERSSEWQKGRNKLSTPHQQIREIQERIGKEATAYVMVVGGGATATGAINNLLEKTGGNNIIVIQVHDPKDLAGQTKKIEWSIHNPARNQKEAATAFEGPVLSIGSRLSEEEISDISKDLGVDFIIDARGLTADDEKKLTDPSGAALEYGLDHSTLVSREFIDLVHEAENDLAQDKPEAMITLLSRLDLSDVVISGAGKVGTQDLVAKVRLLQVAQIVYRQTGRLIDFQKFATKNTGSFSVNLKNIGLTPENLGKVTVVNRSLPRILESKPVHQADTFQITIDNPIFSARRREFYAKLAEIENLPPETANMIASELAKHYYDKAIDKTKTTAYTPLVAKLKPASKELLDNFFDEEEIRKLSTKFQEETYHELKEWQDEFGFKFVEGVTPNAFDPDTHSISYDKAHDDTPSRCTLLLSALGVNKYGYPSIWEPIPGKVAGMRAVGSGNISASVNHVKKIIEAFLQSPPRKKSITQNRALLSKFEALLETYPEGTPLESMVAHSPWLLIKEWLADPIKSKNIEDFHKEITAKVNSALAWEAHQLLTHVTTKMASNVTDNSTLNILKSLKLENLNLIATSELGRTYQEISITDLGLPFRLRLDEHGKLYFARHGHPNKTTWTSVNNLTQFDYLIRKELGLNEELTPSYSDKEDKLLGRFSTTKNIVQNDLLDRFLRIDLRNKYGYTNEELLALDITAIFDKLHLRHDGIQLSNYHSKLTQGEFDQIVDLWHRNKKLTEVGQNMVEQIMRHKDEALVAIGGVVTGSAASLLNADPKTIVEISSLALGITTLAAATISNLRLIAPNHSEKLDNAARAVELIGIGILGFAGGFLGTEFIHPSPTHIAQVDTEINERTLRPARETHLIHPSPAPDPVLQIPTIPAELIAEPSLPLIPENFSSLTDAELLNHLREALGGANWVNDGDYAGYKGRPVELADVLFKILRANQDSFTPEEVRTFMQIAQTGSVKDLIELIKQGAYTVVFNN